MKLGFLTAAFPELTVELVAEWAAAEGFETLEVAYWPAGGGEQRRYAGVTHIDVDSLDPQRTPAQGDLRGAADPGILERLPELQPLTGDFGRPEGVAEAAVYLATAPFVTGAVLTVDGGWTAR